MGLLTVGKALTPEETAAVSSYIRDHGIAQFLSTWNRVKDIANDELRFGDEIECGVFEIDPAARTIKLSVRSAELLEQLEEKEELVAHQSEGCTWHPEFGSWMIESTPSRPYTNYVSDLLRVERNMTLRRRRLLSVLRANEIAPTVTCFLLMGVGDFIANPRIFETPHSLSTLLPDYVINPHPRFAALTRNIRVRRGGKVDIRIPLFQDERTPEVLREAGKLDAITGQGSTPSYSIDADHFEPDLDIHMDTMGFGMGMCCLQVTFQGRDVDESRYMYDQLAVLAPIMLAMTAASPIFKGRLADIDVRWTVIAQSVDDRTPMERGLFDERVAQMSAEELAALHQPGRAGDGMRRIPKSRYDSVSTYIYHCKGDPICKRTFESYNDIPCPVDTDIKTRLLEAGIDENLAHHLAHLFTRDPLVVFEGMIELDDAATTEHFENIQSTNWQTCRWKPPPPRLRPEDPHIGWRTEFRSMEVQLTDFENAAFTVFVVLVTRVLLAFDLALYIPLSKVDENMKRAHQRDAVRTQQFFFRKHVAPPSPDADPAVVPPAACAGAGAGAGGATVDGSKASGDDSDPAAAAHSIPLESCYEEMTMDEIFNGKGKYFPGLIPLVYAYLDFLDTDPETFKRVDQYLKFISSRAKGEIVTTATWMRSFVQTHPEYKQDSIVPPAVALDLLVACKEIGEGIRPAPEILGPVHIDRVRPEDAYGRLLPGRLSSVERSALLERLAERARSPRDSRAPRGQSFSVPQQQQKGAAEPGQLASEKEEEGGAPDSVTSIAAAAAKAVQATLGELPEEQKEK